MTRALRTPASAMTTIFGLLAKYWKRNDHRNSSEPKLVVGIPMNPEPPIEQLFEEPEDPLASAIASDSALVNKTVDIFGSGCRRGQIR